MMIPVFILLFTSLLYPPALTPLSVPGALIVSRAGMAGDFYAIRRSVTMKSPAPLLHRSGRRVNIIMGDEEIVMMVQRSGDQMGRRSGLWRGIRMGDVRLRRNRSRIERLEQRDPANGGRKHRDFVVMIKYHVDAGCNNIQCAWQGRVNSPEAGRDGSQEVN